MIARSESIWTNQNDLIQWVADMFKISEIKRWAKDKGYTIVKEKDDSINGASYYWSKNDDPTITGVALSVSKVATAIFNHISDNKWVEHQTEYQNNKEEKRITLTDYEQ